VESSSSSTPVDEGGGRGQKRMYKDRGIRGGKEKVGKEEGEGPYS